jgi:hypothetical protein
MTLSLKSSIFHMYVIMYHFHLLMECISPSWFSTQEHSICVWEYFKVRSISDVKASLTMDMKQIFQHIAQWEVVIANNDVTGFKRISFEVIISKILRSLYTCLRLHLLTGLYAEIFVSYPLIVRMSFSYWLWRRVIPHTRFRLRAHGGCDRSAEDAYSSMAPDPILAFVGVRVSLHLTL